MEIKYYFSSKYLAIISCILVVIGLYFISLHNYLLFHSFAEIFSIFVAWGIFMIAWSSRRFLDNNYLRLIGIAYLFIGGIDLLHTLSYEGMGVFKDPKGDLATQLWIAARYLQSLSLLIAPLFLGRRFNAKLLFLCYGAAFILLICSIFYWNIFPVCFVEGRGLTPFKKISEYIISLIFIFSIVLLKQRHKEIDKGVFQLLIASIIVTIFSELAFTSYIHAYGFSNLVGHYFKIISFYFIYKAIIETGLIRPYDLLFRNLRKSEEVLRKSEARYRAVVEDQTELIFRFLPDMTITFANLASCRYFNKQRDELIGRNVLSFIFKDDIEKVEKDIFSLNQKTPANVQELRVLNPKGQITWHRWTNRAIFDSENRLIEFQVVGRDITVQKRAEEALQKAREGLERQVKERTAQVRSLSAKLLDAHEKESKRIGQELHDGLAQTLSAIKIWVENAITLIGLKNIDEAVKSLESVVPLAQGSVEEVRRISRNLRPSILDDLGISATISWLCDEFENVYSKIALNKEIFIEEEDVPDPLKTVIFRIMQEALNNIAKHSKTEVLDLSLKKIHDSIELTIKDNGVGFDMKQIAHSDQMSGGLGLASMRERTELSGGSFSIESRKGRGTTISASWPVSEGS